MALTAPIFKKIPSGLSRENTGQTRDSRPVTPNAPILEATAKEMPPAPCACGGGCPRCAAPTPMQPDPPVNQPGDRHEQEADRLADAALDPHASTMERASPVGPMTPGAARSSSLAVAGENLNASGQALPEPDRHFFESRLGHDLSGVRVHTGTQAAQAAQALSAQAFTHGQDVYFGAGKFQPTGTEGRRLLAHELAHTVQQAAGGSAPRVMRKPLPGEDAAAYKRRQEIIDDAKVTVQTLEHCLAKKIPCGDETVTPTGDFKVNGWGGEVITESAATHDGRLNQLVAELKDIQHQLESASPSAGDLADVHQHVGGGLQIFSGSDLDNMYVRHALAKGLAYKTAALNALYIDHVVEKKHQTKPAPVTPKKKIPPSTPRKTTPSETKPKKTEEAEPPRHFEEKTPYTIVVPDPQNAPLVYHVLLSGFDDNRGHILDVFRDEKGHFYRGYHDQKVYLPHWQDPH